MKDINPLDVNKKDRLIKYGLGSIRLFIHISLMIYLDKDLKIFTLTENHRYLFYILCANFGAIVNVEILNPIKEIMYLILLLTIGFFDLSFDFTILLYTSKTFIPDFFASKLDRGIWIFLLIISSSSFLIFNFFFNDENSIFRLINIWTIMAFTQLFCELGDKYLESYSFFRHRYSFEISMLLVWFFCLPMSEFGEEERRFFYFDCIASLSYRFSGFILKYFSFDSRKKKNE